MEPEKHTRVFWWEEKDLDDYAKNILKKLNN